MKIASAEDLGRMVRQKRKEDGLTLEEAAGVCGVSYAFFSALETARRRYGWTRYCRFFKASGFNSRARRGGGKL